jgi:hypothetical protein
MQNGTTPIQHHPSKVSRSSGLGIMGRITSGRIGQWRKRRSCQRMDKTHGVCGSGQGRCDVWSIYAARAAQHPTHRALSNWFGYGPSKLISVLHSDRRIKACNQTSMHDPLGRVLRIQSLPVSVFPSISPRRCRARAVRQHSMAHVAPAHQPASTSVGQ